MDYIRQFPISQIWKLHSWYITKYNPNSASSKKSKIKQNSAVKIKMILLKKLTFAKIANAEELPTLLLTPNPPPSHPKKHYRHFNTSPLNPILPQHN